MMKIAALSALVIAALHGGVSAQESVQTNLVGTWRLVTFDQAGRDGKVERLYGEKPVGMHIFDPAGNFIYMAAKPGIPRNKAPNRLASTAEENKAIVEGTHAYFGKYKVDEGGKTITMDVEASTFPNQVGTGKRNVVAITPTELRITNETAAGLNTMVFRKDGK